MLQGAIRGNINPQYTFEMTFKKQKAYVMYLEGKDISEIANELELPYSYVKKYVELYSKKKTQSHK